MFCYRYSIIAIVVMVPAVDVCFVVSIVAIGLVVVDCAAASICSFTTIVSPTRPIYSSSLVYLMRKHVALKPILLCGKDGLCEQPRILPFNSYFR